MTKSPIFLNKPLLDDNQQYCVDVLREALEQAEEGKIFACAVVVCMDGGFASVIAGTRAGDLNLACDEAKSKILDAVRLGAAAPTKPKASILRVR